MAAKALLCVMVAGSAFVIGFGRRDRTPPPKVARERPPEKPWLTHEAAAQLVDDGGGPGPLFDSLPLGGSAPSPEARAKIDEFARANHVEIHFDVADDALAAIRIGVVFPGGFGYEGADMFALRLRRPTRGGGCMGPWPAEWIDNWVFARDDVHVRAKVNVNRVDVRWERTATADELLERADTLLGKDIDKVQKVLGDRLVERYAHHYLLELPMAASGYSDAPVQDTDLGLQIETHAGHIVAVTFALDRYELDDDKLAAMLRKYRRHRDRKVDVGGGMVVFTSSG